MIDPKAFNAQIVFLSTQAFNRELTRETKGLYYEALSPNLTTDQFLYACRKVFEEEPRFNFPPPAKFLEKVTASLEDQATVEWQRILAAASKGVELLGKGFQIDPANLPQLSQAGWKALTGLGGLSAIARLTEDKYSFSKRDFVAAFKSYHSPAADPDLDRPKLSGATPTPDVASQPTELPPNELTSEEGIEYIRKVLKTVRQRALEERAQKLQDCDSRDSLAETTSPTSNPDAIVSPLPQISPVNERSNPQTTKPSSMSSVASLMPKNVAKTIADQAG